MTRLLCFLLLFSNGSCKTDTVTKQEPKATTTKTPRDVLPKTDIAVVRAPTLSPENRQGILDQENIVDQEPILRIGSPVPAFRVDGWLQGEAVTLAAGKVYIIENWATWCQPCIEQMPHLSTLVDNFHEQGVVVVAVNVEEDGLDAVRDFVKEHAAQMRYPVAFEQTGRMQKHWISPAQLAGLPASFVVGRDGKVAWVGHPEQLGKIIPEIMAGRWNLAEKRQEAINERLAAPYSRRVITLLETDPDRGYQLVRALLSSVLANQPEYLAGLAYHILAAPSVTERDLPLAYVAGALGCQLEEWANPKSIETLSKIQESLHNSKQAIALQERAVTASQGAPRYTNRLLSLEAEIGK